MISRKISIYFAFFLLLVSVQGKPIQTIGQGNDQSTIVAWNPTEDKLAIGYNNGNIRVLDIASGQFIQTLSTHTRRIEALAWSSDGSKLASGGFDQTVNIWDVSSGALLQSIQNLNGIVAQLLWYPEDQNLFILSARESSTITVWDTINHIGIQELVIGSYVSASFNHTNSQIALAGPSILLLDSNSLQEISYWQETEPPGSGFDMGALAWSNDGLIAVGSLNGSIRIINPNTNMILQTLQGSEIDYETSYLSQIRAITFSQDNTIIRSISGNGTIRSWNVDNGSMISTFDLPESVQGSQWNFSGNQVAYATGEINPAVVNVATPSQSIISLTLVNSDTDTDIRTLNSTDTVDIANNGISIRADTDPATVGSVIFSVDGEVIATDSDAPYTIAGENGADILPWNIALGTYEVIATPYSGADGTGDAGTPMTVQLEIIDSG